MNDAPHTAQGKTFNIKDGQTELLGVRSQRLTGKHGQPHAAGHQVADRFVAGQRQANLEGNAGCLQMNVNYMARPRTRLAQ